MPWVKISSDAHKDMKQFLVDVDGLSLGELIEAAFEFCMENLEDSSGKHEGFEKFLELEESEEAEEAEETDDDKQDEEEDTEEDDKTDSARTR
jgi:hypothetical protein